MIPVSTAELPLPSENRQRELAFDAPDEIPEPEPQAEVEPPTTDDPEA
jgi:hypothetical protein